MDEVRRDGNPKAPGRLRRALGRPATPWIGYAALLLAAPWCWDSGFGHALLTQIGIAIIAGLAYNLLYGYGGMLSFGHAVYGGLGAFLAIHTLRLAGQGALVVPVSLVPVVGGLAGLGVAALLGWLSTARAGTPFEMITLGLGELVWALALMLPEVFGGDAGISADRVVGVPVLGIRFGTAIEVYGLVAAYCFFATLVLYRLIRTPFGLALAAVRENPLRVECLGYNVRRVRYLAFLCSGFFSGLAGGLAAVHHEIVSTEALGATRSATLLLFVVLGGARHFWGPVAGAVVMVLAMGWLSEGTPAWLFYVGLLFVAVVMFAPAGLAGLLEAAVVRWQAGVPREVWPWALMGGLSASAALGGFVVIVEMAYHRQLQSSLGPWWRLGSVSLDVSSPLPWACAALAVVSGTLASRRAWRRVRAAVGVPVGAAPLRGSGHG